jgi:hypothetical protein
MPTGVAQRTDMRTARLRKGVRAVSAVGDGVEVGVGDWDWDWDAVGV